VTTLMQNDVLADLARGNERARMDDSSLLVFQLARQLYALPVDLVEQIIEMVTITPIPQEDERIEGVINVRGAMVPVVDLGRVLGLPATQPGLHTPIVLARTSARTVGLIVSEVRDVINVSYDRILRPEDFLPSDLGATPLIEGIVHASEAAILVLDLVHLFTSEKIGLARVLAYLATLEASVGGGRTPSGVGEHESDT
jgi:purine-binding chemotaxis protein CheW